MPRPIVCAVAAMLAGCAHGVSTATIDHAIMPVDAYGRAVLSPDYAVGLAAFSLGHPSNTENEPGNAALALAAVDYLAGDFYVDPRFTGLDALDKVRMLQGRGELRRLLAIAPGATSQQVVDGLISASFAYQAHDDDAVLRALPPAVFTLGPTRTTQVLSHVPYLVSANAAAQSANNELTFGCGNSNCF